MDVSVWRPVDYTITRALIRKLAVRRGILAKSNRKVSTWLSTHSAIWLVGKLKDIAGEKKIGRATTIRRRSRSATKCVSLNLPSAIAAPPQRVVRREKCITSPKLQTHSGGGGGFPSLFFSSRPVHTTRGVAAPRV